MAEPTKDLRVVETNGVEEDHSLQLSVVTKDSRVAGTKGAEEDSLHHSNLEMSELAHVPAVENAEETEAVAATNELKDDENDTNNASESTSSKFFPLGSSTTAPMQVENCIISVNMSSIPTDLALLNHAATVAALSVLSLSPDRNFVYGKPTPLEFMIDIKRIPAEIRTKIFKLAMTAEGHTFNFADKVGFFKPNVAVGLLRTSRPIYHDAKPYLYSENVFVFTRCGTDLYLLNQAQALATCKYVNCAINALTISKLVFDLGDNESIDKGQMKIQTFTAALHALRTEVRVGSLHIYFRDCCWAATERAEDFADALGKIKIVQSLEMTGPDFHWQENLRAIPEALAMNVVPVRSCLLPGTKEENFKGSFTCKYRPAMAVEETQGEGEVKDVGFCYREYWKSL